MDEGPERGEAFNIAGTTTSFMVEAPFLNVLNRLDYLVGPAGFFDDGSPVSINATTFGQTTSAPGPERPDPPPCEFVMLQDAFS